MKNILSFFFLLSFSFLINGQIYTEKKADSILNNIIKKDSVYAKTAHDLSFYFYKNNRNYPLAIKYGLIEISTIEKNIYFNDSIYANALYNVGKFQLRLNKYNNAIINFSKAIKTKSYPLKKAQSYCEIAKCYRIKGDLYKSYNYYLKGIPLIKKHATLNIFILHSINFSLVCKEIGTSKSNKKGIFYLKKVDSTLNKYPTLKNSYKFYTSNASLANLYASKNSYNYKKAKYYYLKNLNKALTKKNNLVLANSYLNLGELYLNKGNDSCLYFLKKSTEFNIKQKTITSEAYRNLANYYTINKNFNEALKKIKKSLNISFKVKNNETILALPKNSLLNVLDKRNVIRALKSKIEIFIHLFRKTKDTEYLNKAIETVNLADKLIAATIEYSTENDTHFLWRQIVSDIYTLGIRVSHLLNRDSLMFIFMEKNKAFLLTTDINSTIKSFKLPLKIASKNLEFKKSILQLESNNSTTQIKDSLFNLKERYTYFKDSIAKIYPQYSIKENRELLSLDKVKEKLLENEIIISYTLNHLNFGKEKTDLFGLLVSNKKSIPFKVKDATEFLKLLEKYKTSISKPLVNKNELDNFKENSSSLYELLFPSKEIRELIKNKNITIVPDTNLENIPFEALNTNKKKLSYLIEKCNISYAYSFSFSTFNSSIKRKTTTEFIGFAPVDFETSQKPSLKYSNKEVTNINDLFNGDIYTQANATKENFIKQSSKSKIIHLATHASSKGNPSIDFYSKKLELYELYTYKNNADLVVLSACETNLGEIKKGEGVLSLARGFFYSGANSVISSLWNVNDTSTSFLMENFYSNLKKKQSKTEALNNAKRTYLQSHSLSERSPYYWASFVLIGDTTATFKTNYLYYLLPVFLGLLILLFFLKDRVTNNKVLNSIKNNVLKREKSLYNGNLAMKKLKLFELKKCYEKNISKND